MADLYTSLVRAKQELNGGTLPAMTPIPDRLRDVIDPGFTIGMGALREDPERGLQCPVRDCGKWYHSLGRHLENQHARLGGRAGLRRLLDLPATASLSSTRERARRRDLLAARALPLRGDRRGIACQAPEQHRRAGRARRSTGLRNFANRCDAQIKQRMAALYESCGRSPTFAEAKALDPGVVWAAIDRCGSWSSAKAQFGYEVWRGGSTGNRIHLDDVLTALQEYYRATGRLPSAAAAQRGGLCVPRIPNREVIIRELGGASWEQAMRIAASLLDIHGGPYGLPECGAA